VRKLFGIFVVAGLTIQGTSAVGANLLQPGGFDAAYQLAGWSCTNTPDSSYQWNSDDAGGMASSGSLRIGVVDYDDPVFGIYPGDSGCLVCAPTYDKARAGARYDFGAQARNIAGAPRFGMLCSAYASANCSGGASDLPEYLDFATNSFE
jgi:hypothetical protein